MSSFSEAMTNDFERDYSDINNQIIDIVKNQDNNNRNKLKWFCRNYNYKRRLFII